MAVKFRPPAGQLKSAWARTFLLIFVALFVLGWIVYQFDTRTELTPTHPVWRVTLGFGACFGIAAFPVGWRGGRRFIDKLANGAGLFVGAIISTFVPGHSLADMVWNAIDFPAAKTRTFPNVLLLVDHAYRTHGKGAHNGIDTTPLPADLHVTSVDYDFMLAHRRPGDHGADDDHIASDGWFCANVTLQQAGDAIRILHAGEWSLPEGSIRLCPTDPGGQSHILMVRNGRLSARPDQP